MLGPVEVPRSASNTVFTLSAVAATQSASDGASLRSQQPAEQKGSPFDPEVLSHVASKISSRCHRQSIGQLNLGVLRASRASMPPIEESTRGPVAPWTREPGCSTSPGSKGLQVRWSFRVIRKQGLRLGMAENASPPSIFTKS
jgi:hypothetical protein